MKLENQLTCLKLSQEVKKAGYKQEGIWWWVNFKGKVVLKPLGWKIFTTMEETLIAVAPTVAEWGVILLQGCDSGRTDYELNHHKAFFCSWRKEWIRQEEPDISIYADIEANARAKMYLYFRKKGLL